MSILVSQVHAGKLQHTRAKTGLSFSTHLVSLPFVMDLLHSLTWTWIVAAQNFEYKISCILDKPTESMFGYISVLVCRFVGIAGVLF
jgi:cellulose synthase/poly-beta-1,6-N-acetylglucosamine synthase-like glycosyltransferase